MAAKVGRAGADEQGRDYRVRSDLAGAGCYPRSAGRRSAPLCSRLHHGRIITAGRKGKYRNKGKYPRTCSFMPETKYAIFEALNPFFEIIQKGLTGLVDGEHYFDTVADDAFFDFRYRFPGWPPTIRGRADLMAQFSGYGDNIRLHSADGLVVHHAQDRRVVILEYEVHGRILSSGTPYDNRFISVVTIKNRKIVHWRDYMDSLAAWTALKGVS
jgi:uncharacterized protein